MGDDARGVTGVMGNAAGISVPFGCFTMDALR